MLSIIIPFVGEYPQVLFTIQSVAQNLLGNGIQFEIIAIDNYCQRALNQAVNIANRQADYLNKNRNRLFTYEDVCYIHNKMTPLYENKSGEAVEACSRGNEWLKYVKYDENLSHWQSKRIGVEKSSGDILLFLDAHVVPSQDAIPLMYEKYKSMGEDNGTLHLPLTYKILEWRRLVYKLYIENNYFYTYKFTGFPDLTFFRKQYQYNYDMEDDLIEVPCMSTCGMMISRSIYDKIGGWPDTLGIYGGGENFMNYTLAICGFKKYIYPYATLFHHGERRDYHYEGDDLIYNRMLAHFLFGGQALLRKFVSICKGRKQVLEVLAEMASMNGLKQRNTIKDHQIMTIEDWAERWT